jgi:hypothetical protein
MLVRMPDSIESKIVKTEMMEKIPIVMPRSESAVRTLFSEISCRASK